MHIAATRGALCALILFVSGIMATAAERVIPYNTKLFIEDMDGDLDGYIRAEIAKESIPIKIVLDKDAADLVMIGSSAEKKGKWHEGWLTMRGDRAQGNISIIDPEEKIIVWSSEAGDRSLWKGMMSRGGERKVAERLVNNLKDVVKKK